jgi:hypothetical protein
LTLYPPFIYFSVYHAFKLNLSLVVIFFVLPLIDHVSLLVLLIIITFIHHQCFHLLSRHLFMSWMIYYDSWFSTPLYLFTVRSPPLAIDSTLNVSLSLGIEPTMIKFTTNIFHVQFLKMILSFVICTLGYNLQSSTLGNLVRDSDKCDVIGNMMWTHWELKPTLPQRKKFESLSCILFNLIGW